MHKRGRLLVAVLVTLSIIFAQFIGLFSFDNNEVVADPGTYTAIGSYSDDINIQGSNGDKFKGFCLNSNKSSFKSGDTFTVENSDNILDWMSASDSSIYSTKEQLINDISKCMYNGFPYDAIGLQEQFKLSDAEFKTQTQYAIWHYTDGDALSSSQYACARAIVDSSFSELPSNLQFIFLRNNKNTSSSSFSYQNSAVLAYISPYANVMGEIVINKINTSGDRLGGAQFTVSVNPLYSNYIYGELSLESISVVRSDNGEPVDQTMYSYNPDNNTFTFTTSADYDLILKNINIGKYLVTEIQAPAGYEISSPKLIHVMVDSYGNTSLSGGNGSNVLSITNWGVGEPHDEIPVPELPIPNRMEFWKVDNDYLDSTTFLPVSTQAIIGGATITIGSLGEFATEEAFGFYYPPVDLSGWIYVSGAADTPTYDANTNTWTFTTVAHSPVVFENVLEGFYYVDETVVPEGYFSSLDTVGGEPTWGAFYMQADGSISNTAFWHTPDGTQSVADFEFFPSFAGHNLVTIAGYINVNDPANPSPVPVPPEDPTPDNPVPDNPVPDNPVPDNPVPDAEPTPDEMPTSTPTPTVTAVPTITETDSTAITTTATPVVTETTGTVTSTGEGNSMNAVLALFVLALSGTIFVVQREERMKTRNKYKIRKPNL